MTKLICWIPRSRYRLSRAFSEGACNNDCIPKLLGEGNFCITQILKCIMLNVREICPNFFFLLYKRNLFAMYIMEEKIELFISSLSEKSNCKNFRFKITQITNALITFNMLNSLTITSRRGRSVLHFDAIQPILQKLFYIFTLTYL